MYIRFNFLMVFLMIPFLIEKHRGEKLTFVAGKAATALACMLILYSPWIYRNYLTYGKIRFMPTTGMGLYSSNVTTDYTRAGGYNGVPDSLLKKYANLSELEFDKALNEDAMNFVKSNPDIYVKGIPFRFMKYASRQDWTISYFFEFTKYESAKLFEAFFQSIENFMFWIILFFSFIYLLRLKNPGALPVFILWAYLVYSMLLIPVSESRSRYNFPYILFPMFAIALCDRNSARNIFAAPSGSETKNVLHAGA